MNEPEESVEERQTRLGHNERLFRAVNERMRELNETFAVVTDDGFVVVCECGDLTCVQVFSIPKSEYARLRTDPTLFVLFPGHEDATVEAVIEDDRRTAYLVVRKHPRVLTEDSAE